HHARGDVHGPAGHVVAVGMYFTDMGADPDLQIEVSKGFHYRAGASQRPPGRREGDEESVTGGVDLASAIPFEAAPDRHTEAVEQFAPGLIAEVIEPLGRADQIQEQQGDDGTV